MTNLFERLKEMIHRPIETEEHDSPSFEDERSPISPTIRILNGSDVQNFILYLETLKQAVKSGEITDPFDRIFDGFSWFNVQDFKKTVSTQALMSVDLHEFIREDKEATDYPEYRYVFGSYAVNEDFIKGYREYSHNEISMFISAVSSPTDDNEITIRIHLWFGNRRLHWFVNRLKVIANDLTEATVVNAVNYNRHSFEVIIPIVQSKFDALSGTVDYQFSTKDEIYNAIVEKLE